jgi:DNA invertase Pin-like site-specific DNA recombinase
MRTKAFVPVQYRTILPPYPDGYTPRRVGIYSRISYDKHGNAEGVERQVGMLRARILQRWPGVEIDDTFIDNDRGASALSKSERPEYDRLISEVNRGTIDAVVVARVDRWTRRPREMLDSLDWILRLNLIWSTMDGKFDTSTSAGRANIQREAIRAEEEAAIIGQRTADAVYWRRINGEVGSSQPAFGYVRDASPDANGVNGFCTYRTPHETEAWIVETLFDKASRGMAPAGLLAWLRSPEVVGRYTREHRWSSVFVSKVLRNPIYAGLVPFRGKPFLDADGLPVVAVDMVPLVQRSVWEETQRQIDNRPKVSRNGGSRRHVLAGLVICGKCGSKMQAQVFTRTRKVAKPVPTEGMQTITEEVGRWYCLSRTGGCGSMARNYDAVQQATVAVVRDALLADDVNSRVVVERDDEFAPVIVEYERKIAKLDAAVAAEMLDESDASRLRIEHRQRIRALEHEQSKTSREREVITTESRERLLLLLEDENPANLWDRRELVTRYVDHIVILPARRGAGIDWEAIRVVPPVGIL